MEDYETFFSHEALSHSFSPNFHFGIEDQRFLRSPRGIVSPQTERTDMVLLESNDRTIPINSIHNGYRWNLQDVPPHLTQPWPTTWHSNTFPFFENEPGLVGELPYHATPQTSINAALSLRQVSQDKMDFDESASKPEKVSYPRLDPSRVRLLESWLEANPSNPYPSRDEKEFLVNSTGFELKQVEAWFSRNRRKKAGNKIPLHSAREGQRGRLDSEIGMTQDRARIEAQTGEDTGTVTDLQNLSCQTACSHSSLRVLKSSVGDDERSQHGLSKRWSESHLPHTLGDESEKITPFQGWPGSHLAWWFQHSSQRVPDKPPSYQRSPTANRMRFKTQHVIDVTRLDDISATIPGDILVPPLILGESYPGHRDKSCTSSMSGVSRFSGRSRSSQKYPAARGIAVNGYPTSSVLSLGSFDSSRSRQHCAGNSDSSIAEIISVPKRRKLTNSSAVSVDSVVTCSSEVSHHSKDRRQGRRTFNTSRHPSMSRKADLPENKFWCTFCDMAFKDKYRWQRHEESTHCSPHVWVCRPQPPNFLQGSLFSQPWTNLYSATAEQCWSKPPRDRTFYRKDAMIQHLSLVHKSDITSGPPNVIVDNLKIKVAVDVEVLRCQFCKHTCATWEDRVAHLSRHFENETRLRRLNQRGAPKSWQQPHETSPTSFPDLERFVRKGRPEKPLHSFQWHCPACSYSTYSSPSMPYIHACNDHWDELHDFALPLQNDHASHIDFGHVQQPSQPTVTLEHDCTFRDQIFDAELHQIVQGWKKPTPSLIDKTHHSVEIPQLGMHKLRRR